MYKTTHVFVFVFRLRTLHSSSGFSGSELSTYIKFNMGARTQDWACLSAVGLIASDGEHVFGTVCIYVCLKVCLLRKKNRTKNM